MKKTANLATVIDAGVKEAVDRFCRQRGLKLSYLVEQALVEQLEDAEDIEAYWSRRLEPTVPLAKVLAPHKTKKKK